MTGNKLSVIYGIKCRCKFNTEKNFRVDRKKSKYNSK